MARLSERSPLMEPAWLRWASIACAAFLIFVIVVLPLAIVLVEAFGAGLQAYISNVTEADTVAAMKLTLLVAALCVPANIIFGIAAAWAKHHLVTSLMG